MLWLILSIMCCYLACCCFRNREALIKYKLVITTKLRRVLCVPDTEILIIGYWMTWVVIPIIIILVILQCFGILFG